MQFFSASRSVGNFDESIRTRRTRSKELPDSDSLRLPDSEGAMTTVESCNTNLYSQMLHGSAREI